jgi:hypothetical protein
MHARRDREGRGPGGQVKLRSLPTSEIGVKQLRGCHAGAPPGACLSGTRFSPASFTHPLPIRLFYLALPFLMFSSFTYMSFRVLEVVGYTDLKSVKRVPRLCALTIGAAWGHMPTAPWRDTPNFRCKRSSNQSYTVSRQEIRRSITHERPPLRAYHVATVQQRVHKYCAHDGFRLHLGQLLSHREKKPKSPESWST